jgi:hypothetical protein
MSSEARTIANRLNAQKSTGPRTAEGKAAVAQNAVKHGLSAQCDVIRGEDQEEFDLYREEMFWELNPTGTMQSRLAERIVSLAWRLRRAERLQNEAFDALLTKETSSPLARLTRSLHGKEQDTGDSGGCDGDPALAQTVVRDFANSRVLDRLLMYERRIESSLYRTMAELQKLRHTQEPQASGEHCPPYECGDAPALSQNVIDFAKQSQSPPGDGVHSTPYEGGDASAGGETPDGVTTNGGECAKQSQAMPGDGVHGTPYEGGDASPGEGTPDGVTTSASNCAKQSQSAPGDGVHGTPCESGDANADNDPPEGGTPSAGECAKQSQSMTEEVSSEEETPDGVTTSARDCTKQSQQAAGLKAIPQARPRVAYHYHTAARPY